MLQGLHSVAYQGALARPLIAPPGAAARITPDDLAQFVADNFTGANMALAGGAPPVTLDPLKSYTSGTF